MTNLLKTGIPFAAAAAVLVAVAAWAIDVGAQKAGLAQVTKDVEVHKTQIRELENKRTEEAERWGRIEQWMKNIDEKINAR